QQDKTRIVEKRHHTSTLLDIVHSLHGAACYCGVPLLRTQLEKLEKLLHDPLTQHPQITLEVDILLAEIERVLDWAQQHPQPDFDV
ncbi:MAG TPA: Hpt domain-containing protein, partial [Pseudomonadales bacterium]|nr:Hpt domain-containing protein [Pseudomonadales bacterium]